ncbi:MAG: carboxypeptidase-like regulatory domain-containing protein, partial [Bacteroidota bacterium]
SGKVTQAETGIPLQGVTITLLETTKTVQTDANGNYFMSTKFIGEGTLEFSLNNFVTQTIAINLVADASLVQNVVLQPIVG